MQYSYNTIQLSVAAVLTRNQCDYIIIYVLHTYYCRLAASMELHLMQMLLGTWRSRRAQFNWRRCNAVNNKPTFMKLVSSQSHQQPQQC